VRRNSAGPFPLETEEGQTPLSKELRNYFFTRGAGESHSLTLKNDGTVVAWGDNSAGETNGISGLTNVHAIAGGGYFSAALTFSPMVQYYPLDVSKDLLLIYNTNSMDSSNGKGVGP
jgi:hypothetical protein